MSISDESQDKPCVDKRPQFGSRFLKDPKNVFEHNAWDNVVWDDDQEQEARKKVEENSAHLVPDNLKVLYEEDADKFWDKFYSTHLENFFKDRHWLFTEFPELLGQRDGHSKLVRVYPSDSVSSQDPEREESEKPLGADGNVTKTEEFSHCGNDISIAKLSINENSENFNSSKSQCLENYQKDPAITIFEIGCGAGNTVFPILETNKNCFVYCCDFSQKAINLVKENPSYDESRCCAFVCDATKEDWPAPFPLESLDIAVLIFVLSSISPEKMQHVVNKISSYLKPGGVLLLRDYGRYDLAQLRFKKGKCISTNFYVRGDGTRVYFFTQDDLREILTKAGLVEELNVVDRRLQVNRGKLLRMYRVWIQCRYRKPLVSK